MTQDANPPPASSNPTWIELSKFIEDQNAVSRAIIDRWFTLAAKVLGVLVFAITFGLGIFGWKTLNDATATAQIVATQTARDEATRVATEVASKTAESAASRVAAEQVKLIMQDPHVQKLISDTAGQLFREGAYRQTVEKAVHDQMQDAITNGVIGNYVVSYNGIPNQSLGITKRVPAK